MKTDFIPVDYSYFDFEGKNFAKIIGRNSQGKSICIIDSCPVYFWAILKNKISENEIKKLIEKIEEIKLDIKGRETKVEKVEVKDKKFLGEDVKALKIFATNYKDLHDIADKLDMPEIEKRRGYDLGFITHYIIEKNLCPLQWYEISGDVLGKNDLNGISEIDIDLCINLQTHKKLETVGFTPKVLAYDIECDELKIGEGEILMVSLVSENFKKVITWKNLDSTKKLDFVEHVKDEKELLEKFVEHVRKISPDFLVGYFSDGFDLPYLKARAEKNKVRLSLGLDDSQPRFFRGAILTGKISGIVHIDLMRFIQSAYSQYMQSETLSLNEVSKEFLGDAKKEFKFKHSSEIKKEEWTNYFEYNLHDSVLTYNLFQKFWQDLLEFTRIMQEPVFSVSRNGMSNNVEDYIIHNLNRFDEIPEKKPHEEIGARRQREKYVGAFVFEPTPGLYEDICIFDFTSFWPSIIVTFNLSRSTLLAKKAKDSLEVDLKEKKLYFSKKPEFFPEMLKEIIEKRKQYKQELKHKPDAVKKARSNAFKLLANASYGYQGFFGARYYCPEASASATAISRDFIKNTIDRIDKKGYKTIYSDSVSGKTKVIVKKDNKIYETEIENLFEKIDRTSDFGKEYNFKKDIQVLTLGEKGNSIFRPIEHVMRHKSDKKMFRINFTNNWHIDVTEDHSLMGYQSINFNQSKINKNNPLNRIIEIKPEEIKKKANTLISLKKIPYEGGKEHNYPKEIYEFMGYFIGDGSFRRNKSHQKYNKDYYLGLSLGSDEKELLEKLINPLKKLGYVKNYWLSTTRKGDLMINGLRLVNLIAKELRDEKNKKAIPEWLFQEKEENIASFLRGLFSADGCVMIRNNAPIIKYTSIDEDYIKEVRKLLYRVGVSHSVFKENSVNRYKTEKKIFGGGSYSKNIIIQDKESFKDKIGFILERKNKSAEIKTDVLKKRYIKNFEFDIQAVKNIEQIKTPGYVYDLEVENNHRFFANYILVHNTDSIAFLMNNHSPEETKKFLKEINENLPGVMELELEDFFKRGIWVTKRTGEIGAKKKYALVNHEGKIKIRGFETVRRDWCTLAREVQNKVIRQILEDGNEKSSLEYVKEIIKQINQRKISKEKLIIRTQLKKPISEYKAISPHVIAAKRMKEREIPIDMGSLVSYYISEPEQSDKKKSKLVRERVKLPDEEADYDIEYYLKHQILPAVENIFQVFGIDINDLIDKKKQKKLSDF